LHRQKSHGKPENVTTITTTCKNFMHPHIHMYTQPFNDHFSHSIVLATGLPKTSMKPKKTAEGWRKQLKT